MSDELLSLRGLSVAFGDNTVVKGIDLDIPAGEIVALVGESGSGKSMVARSLLDLLPAGAISAIDGFRFQGVEVGPRAGQRRADLRGNRIGMVFQEPMTSLDPSMKIGQQMIEALVLHEKIGAEQARRRAVHMLARVQVPAPEAALEKYSFQFSGGLRQRISIASAMLLKPSLLIADEPTTALDVIAQREVLALLVELARDAGAGVLLISHDLPLVARYSDRIVVMRKGEVVETGRTATLMAGQEHDYTRKLLAALPRRGEVREGGGTGEVLMRAEGVCVDYPGRKKFPWSRPETVRCVSDVDLDIRRGELLAIVGESGSGKTTLVRSLLNLQPRSGGRVTFDGEELATFSPAAMRRFRKRTRIVFQDPYSALDPRMRVAAIVGEGLRQEQGLSRAERDARIASCLEEAGLDPALGSRYAHQLSGGQRQRVNIARALVADPELLVADEPVSALDLTVQAEILKLLRRLQQDRNLACIFISHSLSVVEQIADRVMVMRRGRIVELGERDAIFDNPLHPYTRELLDAAPRLVPDGHGGYAIPPRPDRSEPGLGEHAFFDPETGGSATADMIEIEAGHYALCTRSHIQEDSP